MNVHSDTPRAVGPERMHPGIRMADAGAGYWVGQAILRLRREIGWRRELGALAAGPAQMSLDLVRYDETRRSFFETDPASAYLVGAMAAMPVPEDYGFERMAVAAGLSQAERFVLGLAMAAEVDGALGPVIATCQGDSARQVPTLALAQALWDDPVAILAAGDAGGALSRFGLLAPVAAGELAAASGLTRWFAESGGPGAFGLWTPVGDEQDADPVLARRFAASPQGMEIVPLIGPCAADPGGLLAGLSAHGARMVLAGPGNNATALAAWLSGCDLLIDDALSTREQVTAMADTLAPARHRGFRVFLHLTDRDAVAAVPGALLGPVLDLPQASADEMAALLGIALGQDAAKPHLQALARDFRLQSGEIARLTAGFTPDDAADPARLRAAARAECSVDFQGLAQLVKPDFTRADLVLPEDLDRQFDEAMAAIRGAGLVRHDWGDKGALGIGLLFAGPPGTGKTMAAQVIAAAEDLPLFRVDLSQIVNKYIGETEKNLRRVFDTAEKMRCILFFDEAEALFGKRTEVKDANDRFANVETGYLLQRMEQFSGVAILATNRRKDLDDAFARRLRYVLEFPVPAEAERREIWQRVFPPGVDTSQIDHAFLARQFQLTGGHIRSIALNAALQTAARGEATVSMRDVLIATKREMDKLHRKAGRDAFGKWWDEIEELRA